MARPNQAKAFGLLSLCWGLGSLVGPMIGGSLSDPCSTALRVGALCGEDSLLVHRLGGSPSAEGRGGKGRGNGGHEKAE